MCNRLLLAFGLLGILPLSGLAKPLVVQATNYPIFYFAERIATDSFSIQYRVAPDVDPAFWKPGDDDLIAFQQADIILRNGATYSKWMHHASLPSSKIVDTTREIRDQFIKTNGDLHSHGDGEAHSHGGIAFTTWMDFSQAAVQAKAIARRFRAMKPAESGQIDQSLAELIGDLEQLHETALSIGERVGDTPLVASHPIYHYLSRAYGFKIESLVWEPEMKITAENEAELKAILAKYSAKWMIWEDVPTDENREKVKAFGLESVVVSQAANRPEEGDWLEVMKSDLEQLALIAE